MCFYTAFCLYVCIFFLCATILVNKDVYNTERGSVSERLDSVEYPYSSIADVVVLVGLIDVCFFLYLKCGKM